MHTRLAGKASGGLVRTAPACFTSLAAPGQAPVTKAQAAL